MTVPERGGLVVPLMLWGRKCPRSRMCAITVLNNGRTILTGTVDGQLVQWSTEDGVKEEIRPQIMLIAHESPITAIAPASPSSSSTRFVSCSQDGHVCLWDSVDGRVVESVKNNAYIHRHILPHRPASYATSNHPTCGAEAPGAHPTNSTSNLDSGSFLFCTGDYAEIAVMDSQDLNILFNLSSRVEPDWVTSMTIVQPRDKCDVLIGVSASGMIKLWSLTDLDSKKDVTGNVLYEDESKLMPAKHVQSISCSPLNTRLMLVICVGSWQILDPSNLNQLIVSECAIDAQQGMIIDVDRVAIGFADSTIVLFQLPRSRLVGRQVRERFGETPANIGGVDQPFVFALLKGISTSPEPPLWSSVRFHFDQHVSAEGKVKRVAYRVDEQGTLSIWGLSRNYDMLVSEFLKTRRPSVYQATKNQSFAEVWGKFKAPPPSLAAAIDCSLASATETAAVGDTTNSLEVTEHSPTQPAITATIYVGNQGKLLFGREDGSIIMLNACHAIMAQLLETHSLQQKHDQHHGSAEELSVPHRVLNGHSGAVNCFLYPFEESGGRYDAQTLLSGGADFSVIVWDLVVGAKTHRFCCQGGPVLRLMATPPNSSPRVQHCVCCIAGDNSAALLSLKENKCILLASRQQFPIVDVRWRPLDDFMLLRCEDDSVYVWQIETNSLDRVVTGLVTEDVMEACKEQLGRIDGEDEAGASQAIQMLRAMRNKNLNAIKRIAANIEDKGAGGPKYYLPSELPSPIDIVQLSDCSDEAHLVLFNVDALIAGLLSADHDFSLVQQNSSTQNLLANQGAIEGKLNLQALIARKHEQNLQQQVASKDIAASHLPNGRDGPHSGHGQHSSTAVASSPCSSSNLYLDTAHLLISLLHGWNLDANVDMLCSKVLKLSRPRVPLCFGVISRRGHLSMRLPYTSEDPKRPSLGYEHFSQAIRWQEGRAQTTVHLLSIVSVSNTMMSLRGRYAQHPLKKRFSLGGRRRSLSVEGTTASSGHSSPQPSHQSVSTNSNGSGGSEGEQQQVRQAWSNVAALHCVLLPELVHPSQSYSPPRIDLLARRWQDNCTEIRDAAQALLIRELHRMSDEGRRLLVVTWSPFLPTLLDPTLSIFGPKLAAVNSTYASGPPGKETSTNPLANDIVVRPQPPPLPPPPRPTTPNPNRGASAGPPSIPPRQIHVNASLPKLSAFDSPSAQSINSTSNVTNVTSSDSHNAAPSNVTTITIHTASSTTSVSSLPSTVAPANTYSATQSNHSGDDALSNGRMGGGIAEEEEEKQFQVHEQQLQEGRGGGIQQVRRNQATAIIVLGVMGAEFPALIQADSDLARAISQSLLELLLAPESPLLPNNSLLRRAAIDLLGRGFIVWQPHLDISKLLLALLSLAASDERNQAPTGTIPEYLFHSSIGQPLSPEADACRTARHSLSLIASARPHALISALSMEVVRYNQAVQHQTIQHAVQSPLVKSRLEILKLIEQLSDKQFNCVADLIVPVGDILVHCLDTSLLKQKTLGEVFPPIAKFYMVGYCPVTRRIAFGGKNGSIVVHELRASKAQTISCNQAPITALAFSQDGKYLAVYSSQDAKISFWQTQQSFLGMGQSQIRCMRTMPAPAEFPVVTPGGSYQAFRARLIWINSKSLTLMLPNGKEHRFAI